MRAVVMRPEALTVEDRPLPQPGEGQVLMRTLACGICGSDLHLFRHASHYYEMGLKAGVSKDILDRGVVLGHEFVGEIVSFGPKTRQTLTVGSHACAMPFVSGVYGQLPMGASPLVDGAYAEYFLMTEDRLIPVPENTPVEAAALTEPLAIGLHAVNSTKLGNAHPAVVIGCGPIGLSVIASLKLKGFTTIIASDLSDFRRELALRTGATATIDANRSTPFEQIPGTMSSQPIVVFECTGVNGMIATSIERAPARSEIIVAGITHGTEAITPATAITKELVVRFVSFYEQTEFEQALGILASERINWRPWITGHVGLDGVVGAFDALRRSSQHAKILVHPDGRLPSA